MAARRYEIPLRVLNNFASERSEQVKYFSAREEKFRICKRPLTPNLFHFISFCCERRDLLHVIFTREDIMFSRESSLGILLQLVFIQ